MKFKTCDVCSVSTGFLFGKIDGVYEIMSFLIGRPAFTHDLVVYSKAAREALEKAVEGIPTRDDAEGTDKNNYAERLAVFEAKLGAEVDLPDDLGGSIADGRGVMETMATALGKKTAV